MNVLFVGIRENEEEITSAPKKIANCLFNRMSKNHEGIYFYGLPWENNKEKGNTDYKIIKENEVIAPLKYLGRFIKDKKIDVVYFSRYYSKIALYLIALKSILGFKLVYTVHGIIKKEKDVNKSFKFYSAIFEELLLKKSDKIVVVSDGLKSELLKYYPKLNESKINVINNGVSINSNKRETNIRNLFDLDHTKNILLTVGTRKIKNIETLIENFINNEKLYNSSYLLIVGEDDEDYVKGLISRYKNYENLKFVGCVNSNTINNIYEQIDLYIQISRFETFGMSIVEALLYKKNVLISKNLPLAQYFSKEEVFFYDSETDNLGELILDCLEHRDIINYKGCEKVKSIFNWETATEKYYEVFKEAYDNR